MEEVKLHLNEKNHGNFSLVAEGEEAGEMAVSVNGDHMTVYHTEVKPEFEGKGYAKKLLGAMVDYARTHHLKVTPLCPYVHAQFKRHPADYADLWKG